MIKIPFYNKKKLLLSFEYGAILSETLKGRGEKLTPEIMKRAEEIIVAEFSTKSAQTVACDMIPNLMASIETN